METLDAVCVDRTNRPGDSAKKGKNGQKRKFAAYRAKLKAEEEERERAAAEGDSPPPPPDVAEPKAAAKDDKEPIQQQSEASVTSEKTTTPSDCSTVKQAPSSKASSTVAASAAKNAASASGQGAVATNAGVDSHSDASATDDTSGYHGSTSSSTTAADDASATSKAEAMSVPLTTDNLKAFEAEQKAKEERRWFQFGCHDCQELWWRFLPPSRSISRCRRCRVSFQAVPQQNTIGYGKFTCKTCGHVWTNHRSMPKYDQPCRRCGCWNWVDCPPGVGPRMRRLPGETFTEKGGRPHHGYSAVQDQHNCRCCFQGFDECARMPVSGPCGAAPTESTVVTTRGEAGEPTRRVNVNPATFKDNQAQVRKASA